MKSRELLVALWNSGIAIKSAGGGKLRAEPAEKAKEYAADLREHRDILAAVAAGGMRDGQKNWRKCRVDCDCEEPGGCWRCCDWTPYIKDGERTGLCLERLGKLKIKG